jgi:hypothetical protein
MSCTSSSQVSESSQVRAVKPIISFIAKINGYRSLKSTRGVADGQRQRCRFSSVLHDTKDEEKDAVDPKDTTRHGPQRRRPPGRALFAFVSPLMIGLQGASCCCSAP